MKPMNERIESAIESLCKVDKLYDYCDYQMYIDIIAIIIPFVPIDIRDKIEVML